MKRILFLSFIFIFSACKNDSLEQTNKRLLAENNRLIKEIANGKVHADSLQMTIDELANAKDTLQSRLQKQAESEVLRRKATEKPLEMPTILIQNESATNVVLKVKGPFKKAEVRYLSFKTNAVNNLAKVKQKLNGRLYAIYRLGSLVQRMDNTSGTFVGDDGKKYVFTHSWELASDKISIPIDKGIGDKVRGIFEKGGWTLELWFEPRGRGTAIKMTEGKFEIN